MDIIDPEPFDDEEPDVPQEERDDYLDRQFGDGAPLTPQDRAVREAMEYGRQRLAEIGSRPNLFDVRPANEWLRIGTRRGLTKRLFGDLWCENDLSIMFADTGVGKSLFAVQIADAIVRGRGLEPFDVTTRPQRVLLLDFEMNHRQFHDRYSAGRPGRVRRPHEFARGILRAEIAWDDGIPAGYRTYNEFVLASIEQCVIDNGVRVLIVDNISWLVSGGFASQSAAALMKGLKLLKAEFGISILVIAHAVKRLDTLPITIADLAGSKVLANFADNVFALGRCCYSPDLRYLKQLKMRNSPLRHDVSNVVLYRLVTDSTYPHFEFVGYDHEASQIRQSYDTLLERGRFRQFNAEHRAEHVRRLHAGGLSIRRIAARLNISRSSVTRLIKNADADAEAASPDTDTAETNDPITN